MGVHQPGQHDPAVVADHLGVGEAGHQLGGGADVQDLAVGEGDSTVLQVAGRPHGQQVPATNHYDLVHQRLLGMRRRLTPPLGPGNYWASIPKFAKMPSMYPWDRDAGTSSSNWRRP